ncbi:MAG: Trp biosynthesis-associated membrane protein [Acidothermaceae bacterium]
MTPEVSQGDPEVSRARPSVSEVRRARARRELVTAGAGCVIAGATVLFAGGRRWVRYAVVGGGHASGGPTGHDVAAGATALALVMLATAVALPATRGWLRRGVGLVVAAAGAGTIALAAYVIASPGAAAGTRVIGVFYFSSGTPSVQVQASGWPWVDICAGTVALVAGVFALLRSADWPAMGRRYESGRAKPSASTSSAEASMWERFDQGDDPTL